MKTRTKMGILSLALLFALSACGKSPNPESSASESSLQVEASVVSSMEESESASQEESISDSAEESSEELTEEQKTYEKIIATYPAITMQDVNDAIESKKELLLRWTCHLPLLCKVYTDDAGDCPRQRAGTFGTGYDKGSDFP